MIACERGQIVTAYGMTDEGLRDWGCNHVVLVLRNHGGYLECVLAHTLGEMATPMDVVNGGIVYQTDLRFCMWALQALSNHGRMEEDRLEEFNSLIQGTSAGTATTYRGLRSVRDPDVWDFKVMQGQIADKLSRHCTAELLRRAGV